MTRRSLTRSVIDAALEKVRLAYGRGNQTQAIKAIERAFRDRPKRTLSDDDGIGSLGLDDQACDLLRGVPLKALTDEQIRDGIDPGFETIGELRHAGSARLVQLLRQHSAERLAVYARSRKWQAGTKSDVALRLAREVKVSMQSFEVSLPRRGANAGRAADRRPPAP